ncbi:MAG: hypothetical protein U0136_04000 [Bdellovibrionota bacterium]
MKLALAICVWAAAVSVESYRLLSYDNAPGALTSPPSTLADPAFEQHGTNLNTLLVFLHPQCSCSRATLGELARLMATHPANTRAYAIFFAPSNEPQDWIRSSLWGYASSIPNVQVRADEDGRLAQAFHVQTSGEVLLYDAGGNIAFSGGITASRGHMGDNAGLFALDQLLSGQPTESRQTLPFGCHLSSDRSKNQGDLA